MTPENRAATLMQFHFPTSTPDTAFYRTIETLLARVIRQAKEDEREACAHVCEEIGHKDAATAIRNMPVW